MKRDNRIRYLIATALIVFALATLFMSSSVIFDWFGIREREGDYVPFIVWINFIAAFLYLISAYGLLKAQNWPFWVLTGTALLLLMALIILALYINYGGAFELKNVGAMALRIAITFALAMVVYYKLIKF